MAYSLKTRLWLTKEGACNCSPKPEGEFTIHDSRCYYRLMLEAYHALAAADRRIAELQKANSDAGWREDIRRQEIEASRDGRGWY